MKRVLIFTLTLVLWLHSSCSKRNEETATRNAETSQPKMTQQMAEEGARQVLSKIFPSRPIPAPQRISERETSYDLIYPFEVDLHHSGTGSLCVVIVNKNDAQMRVVEYSDYLSRTGATAKGADSPANRGSR
jgi:hypothetical protein